MAQTSIPFKDPRTSDVPFLYDGWNLVAEFECSGVSQHLVRAYAWGRDISGTEQGAGGIGGLGLAQSASTPAAVVAPCYHGNGNVTAYADCGSGAIIAKFDYDPFGRPVWTEAFGGDLPTSAMPFRFSTKYEDSETGLLYYGYRYYSPEMGRWISRDPIEEEGGTNLYCLVGNDSIGGCDYLGQKDYAKGDREPTPHSDPGAGPWNSTPPTLRFRAIKLALQAGGAFFGWENANAHLQHYLGNSGSKYKAKLKDMVNAVPSAKNVFDNELAMAMQFAETLTTPDKLYSRNTSSGYNLKSENADWYYAIGGYASWGKGNVTCVSGNYREMVFEYKFHDTYNWDGGKSVVIQVPEYGPIQIADQFMGQLHRMGLAKEFEVEGSFRKKVTWDKGQAPTVTDLPQSGGR